jgi:outer membrane protein, heavy metal efflux system
VVAVVSDFHRAEAHFETQENVVKAQFLTGLIALAAWAQAPHHGGELKLQRVIDEVLRANPDSLAAQKKYEAARQRPAQASSLPDPMFSLSYNSSGSPRPFAGIGTEPTANAGVMISQEFPFPGKRKLRGDIASKEADADFQQYQMVQLSVLSRLKQAFHKLHHGYESIEVMERNRDLLRQFLRVTEARYAVGKAAQQDIFKAQTQLSILEARLQRMEQDKRSAEAEIDALLGKPVELALNLARKEYYPDYTVSGGYYYMGQMPAMYMARVDFKLPAYFWRKQRAGVAEQANNVRFLF